jgi:hypothetical protein
MGTRVPLRDHWRRISLFLRIVYRKHECDWRIPPSVAWEVAGIVHGQIPAQLDPIIEAAWRIQEFPA